MKFSNMPLLDELKRALSKKGYFEATDIQKRAIPALLQGRDVLAIAQTGTGKTAAFSLPLLHNLAEQDRVVSPFHVRCVILAPTRELVSQIDKSIKGYARHLKFRIARIVGGVKQHQQERVLAKGVDVLVATPGRLLDLYEQKLVSLHNVEYVVLDEADRMLDMGFMPDVQEIISAMPHLKQRCMFSATMNDAITPIAKKLLQSPIHIEVEPQSVTVDAIEQFVLFVDQGKKNALLARLLEDDSLEHVLVFTRTKERSDQLAKVLKQAGIRVGVIHGDKSQAIRTQTLAAFRRKKIRVLIATEIAARGLDINDISHVINFDVPLDVESYIHRIGRTARAGADGSAYLLCTAKEKQLLLDIEKAIGKTLIVLEHSLHSDMAEFSQKSTPPTSRKGARRTVKNTSSKQVVVGKIDKNRSQPRKEMKRWGKNRRDEGEVPRPKRKKK